MAQKQIRIDGLLGLAKYGAEILVWPLGTGAAEHADKADRVSLALYTGSATLHLSPTASEVRALIAALEWAIGAPTVDEAAALERRRASMVADLESRFAEVAL